MSGSMGLDPGQGVEKPSNDQLYGTELGDNDGHLGKVFQENSGRPPPLKMLASLYN